MLAGLYQVLDKTGTLTEFQALVKSLPPALQALMGWQGLDLHGTFVASMAYGAVMSIVFIVFNATYVPGLISKEIDQRSAEFLLALPVRRRSVIGTRWLGLVVALAILAACQWIALVAVTGAEAQPVRYLVASLNMFLVYLETGTLLLLASVFVDDYSRATGACAGLVTFLFFYNGMTETATGLLATVRKAMPFARFDPSSIIARGEVPGANMAILAAGTVVLLYLAIRAFDAKQVVG
jgi:ABC-2 type transport system permease protein